MHRARRSWGPMTCARPSDILNSHEGSCLGPGAHKHHDASSGAKRGAAVPFQKLSGPLGRLYVCPHAHGGVSLGAQPARRPRPVSSATDRSMIASAAQPAACGALDDDDTPGRGGARPPVGCHKEPEGQPGPCWSRVRRQGPTGPRLVLTNRQTRALGVRRNPLVNGIHPW